SRLDFLPLGLGVGRRFDLAPIGRSHATFDMHRAPMPGWPREAAVQRGAAAIMQAAGHAIHLSQNEGDERRARQRIQRHHARSGISQTLVGRYDRKRRTWRNASSSFSARLAMTPDL